MRIIVLCILSIFIPYFFLWTYQIAVNEDLYIPEFNLTPPKYSFDVLNMYLHQKIWYCMVGIISLLSFYELFRWMYKKKH